MFINIWWNVPEQMLMMGGVWFDCSILPSQLFYKHKLFLKKIFEVNENIHKYGYVLTQVKIIVNVGANSTQ